MALCCDTTYDNEFIHIFAVFYLIHDSERVKTLSMIAIDISVVGIQCVHSEQWTSTLRFESFESFESEAIFSRACFPSFVYFRRWILPGGF